MNFPSWHSLVIELTERKYYLLRLSAFILSAEDMHKKHLILYYYQAHLFFGILITLVIIITYVHMTKMAYAEPAPFPRQEVNSATHNIIQINGKSHTQTKATYNQPLDKSAIIQRVTYFSDGKTLNATLWMGGGIKHDPFMYGASIVAYGVLIDIDNNNATGKYGVDYQQEIQWNSQTKTWNSILFEYSSPTLFRTLDIRKNYTGFFKEDERYILLPLTLDSITSPTKFRATYYAVLIYNNNSKTILDLTSWINIPPEHFTLFTLPSPIIMSQGEQKDIGIQLKSSEDNTPQSADYSPAQTSGSVKVEFNPDKLNVSSFSITPAPFRITVSPDAQIGQYTIPVSLNISKGSIFPSKALINVANFSLPITANNYATGNANLTISIIEPPSLGQKIKDFWNTYGSPISLVGAGFAGAFSTYVFDHIRSRKESKR